MEKLFNETPIEKYLIRGKTVYVKREDLCTNYPLPPLEKLRGVYFYLKRLREEGVNLVGVIDTKVSKAGQGVSVLCKILGLSCIVFYPQEKGKEELRTQQKISQENGATLYPLKGNRTMILYYQSKKIITEKGGIMLPWGLVIEDTVKEVEKVANTVPEELLTGTLIVCVGSGTIFSGILRGLQKIPAKVIGIGVGKSNKSQWEVINKNLHGLDFKRILEIRYNTRIINSDYKYEDECKVDCPFQSHPNYDRKAWKYLIDNINNLKDPILFWNIGA